MKIDLFRWPPEAWKYQKVIGEAVRSFSPELDFERGQSASQQLRNRILENAERALSKAAKSRNDSGPRPSHYVDALMLVDDLTEGECRAICRSINADYSAILFSRGHGKT